MQANRIGSWLLAATLLLATAVPAVEPGSKTLAGMDLLTVPALRSDKAAGSLLLDVVRAGTRLVAVGERGIVVYSDDDGAAWSQAQVPVSVTLTTVAFPSPQVGWAAGHDGVVLTSTDAGASWRKVLDGNDINTLVIADLAQRLAQFEADMDPDDADAVERLELLQFSLEDAEAGAAFGPARPILDLWFDSEASGYAIGAFGQLLRTGDGGATWQSLTGRVPNPESLHFNAISRIDGIGLVIAGERGLLWRSADAGESWSLLETGYHGHLYGAFSPDGQALVAYGFAGNAFRSGDAGQTWSALLRATEKSLVAHVAHATGGFTLIARDGRTYASEDGGATLQPAAALPLAAVSAVCPIGDDRIAVAGIGGAAVTTFRPRSR